MAMSSQIICDTDILFHISSFLSLKEIICLSLSSKEAFHSRFFLMKNNDFLMSYTIDHGSSFFKLLFNSALAPSYHIIPTTFTLSNSVKIAKIQAMYSLLPMDICVENLKECASRCVISKLCTNNKIPRTLIKAIELAGNVISYNTWQNTIVSLADIYECIIYAYQGSYKQLLATLESLLVNRVIPITVPANCRIVEEFINTVSFLVATVVCIEKSKCARDKKIAIKTVIVFFMFSLISWIIDVEPDVCVNGKLFPLLMTTINKIEVFKRDIQKANMPKYLKKFLIDNFESLDLKITLLSPLF